VKNVTDKEQGICGKQKGATFSAQNTETLSLSCWKHEFLYHFGTKVNCTACFLQMYEYTMKKYTTGKEA